MKRRYVCLFSFVSLLLVICLTGCRIEKRNETGSFNKMTSESNNYVITIDSSELGHPDQGYVFTTSTKVENKEYNGQKYSVRYRIDYAKIVENKANQDYPNFDKYSQVEINGKKFRYFTDSNTMTLIYQPNDLDCYVNIMVSLTDVYDANGNAVDSPFIISEEDLQSKEIKGVINFELKKK